MKAAVSIAPGCGCLLELRGRRWVRVVECGSAGHCGWTHLVERAVR